MKHSAYVSCDICGSEISKYNRTEIISYFAGFHGVGRHKYDVCRNCMSKVMHEVERRMENEQIH